MKKTALLLSTFFIFYLAYAQQQNSLPKLTLKWAPAGLPAGNISFSGEYHLQGKHAVTAKIGIPVNAKHTFQYDEGDADFNLKATSFLAGYRTYFSKKRLRGFYLEPYFKYVHHQGSGTGTGTISNRTAVMVFSNDYKGAGIGAQLGAQFMISQRVVIDIFFLGPEMNTSTNNFKAVETSAILPWTAIESAEAERDIRAFIDQFPFIRNRTTINVNNNNRTITADFKGFLPGYRAGISFGVAL